MKKPQVQALSDFLTEYTKLMLSSGTYTARVSKCVERIAQIYGYEVNINFFFHHFSINIVDKDDNSINRTYIIPNKHAHLNFKLILDLSALSWAIYDKKYTLENAKKLFYQISTQKKRPYALTLFLVSLGNAAFCRLFGGDFGGFCLVFLGTLVGLSLRYILTKIKIDLRIQYVICAFISSWIVFLGVDTNLTKEADIALGSSILYLIPGVFFINSVIDILKDHILMGLSRIISVVILVCCIAMGIYTTLSLSNYGILQ
ncbi:threonine/serine exporter family protein [Campylobacter upsaliensis]|nr:threonine/serine exporter [Campylobacter upsaliensis]EDP6853658.1 threonine/serine exporter [Campylobacter upsaliensis]EHQ1322687.1 threonine/serine exporter family protein [Campylobacter upsaliensis]EJC0918311.1 threonine/serine exporter family protein [Campylobacter upsaliensis]EKH7231989.1 threonine/serine exporter family protein [Campylobacter upsaliensis]